MRLNSIKIWRCRFLTLLCLLTSLLLSCAPLNLRPVPVADSLSALPQFKPVTLVHFFSTWCTTCAPELIELEALQHEMSAAGLQVFAIALEESPEALARYLARKNLAGSHYFSDPTGSFGREFHISAVPVTLFFNAARQPVQIQDPVSGALRSKFVGPRSWGGMSSQLIPRQ